MIATEPTPEERWQEASRWFGIAEQDLRVADLCLTARPPEIGPAAYHCQQAAEKMLKGLLVAAGHMFRKVHDLDELADQVSQSYPSLPLDTLRPLTQWGTAFRYPWFDAGA
jgi:HEPN domain-containing protein